MATREQMFTALRAADAAGATDDARRIAQMIAALPKASAEPEPAPNPAEGMSATDRFLAGAGGAAARLRDTIFPPANPISMLDPTKTGGQVDAETRARKDDLAAYERNKEALGTAGKVGEIASEVALSSIPVARASNLGSAVLTGTLGRMAPAAGDVLANAGYAAMTADPENRGTAALAGGAGAAGARLLARLAGGAAKPFVSKDAQTLLDAGVTPTPGQLFGDNLPGRMVRGTEDKLTSLPLAGDIIRNARTRSIEQYNNVELNRALAPIGKTVRGAGEDAVEAARRAVSDAYDEALPHTFLTVGNAADATNLDLVLKGVPMVDGMQRAKIGQYLLDRVHPIIEEASDTGNLISGRQAKAIDAELGHYARKYSSSPSPDDHSLGEGFYALQQSWRDALQATTPEAKQALTSANSAYRQLLPSVKASDRAMGQGGRFTPLQFNRAAQKFGQEGDPLNTAARRVLPASIPDSGTAGRALLGATAIGGAMASGTIPHMAGGAALAAIVYSRPGVNFLVNGLRGLVPDKVLSGIAGMAPEQAVLAMTQIGERNPQVAQALKSLGPQLARQAMTQQQQQGSEE